MVVRTKAKSTKAKSAPKPRCRMRVAWNVARARQLLAQGTMDVNEVAARVKLTVTAVRRIQREVEDQALTNSYSAAQAAWLLGLGERRVRKLCKDGRLQAELFGGWTWAIDPASVFAFGADERIVGKHLERKDD